ncbi:TlpA family protein disulfide reductase [Luteibaculum oceani]|uniref:TlpA family protein disulfide reductase n=1 Tax=Luteibaculum oceani TaxID=1294296 RepID=A0A5C6VC11_9FLAO|nr:TlpA disulfide reductase family protein [Luteibaculum oceani]TXC82076.1 TlpA family protein disulfide reductase [Luteibaculum oceani]
MIRHLYLFSVSFLFCSSLFCQYEFVVINTDKNPVVEAIAIYQSSDLGEDLFTIKIDSKEDFYFLRDQSSLALIKFTYKQDNRWERDGYYWYNERDSLKPNELILNTGKLFYSPAILQSNFSNGIAAAVWKIEEHLKENGLAIPVLFSNTKLELISVKDVRLKASNRKINRIFSELISMHSGNQDVLDYILFRKNLCLLQKGAMVSSDSLQPIYRFLFHLAKARLKLVEQLAVMDPQSIRDTIAFYLDHKSAYDRLALLEYAESNYLISGRQEDYYNLLGSIIQKEHDKSVTRYIKVLQDSFEERNLVKGDQRLPSLENLRSLEIVDLNKPSGKFRLLDFWATWCKPCINSFPHLIELHNEFENLEVIGVNVEMDAENPLKFLDKNPELDWLQLIDYGNQKFKQNFKIIGYPWYILIDPDGHVVNTNLPHNKEDLRNYLGEVLLSKE